MEIPDYPLQSSLRPPADLSRPMQVIGAGCTRTGNAAFAKAVEILLGGPVCHGGSSCVLREGAFIKRWIATAHPDLDDEAVKANLRELLAGYVGTADNPCILFVRELVEMYPDAKVICTIRDPESWFMAMKPVLVEAKVFRLPIFAYITSTTRMLGKWRESMRARRMAIYPECDELPDGVTFFSYFGQDSLEIHYDYLKRVVPPERLFFIDVKDGWGPLCNIIGCPVPNVPFPTITDAEVMSEAWRVTTEKARQRWIGILSVSAVVLAIGLQRLRPKSWR